jgi:hypothetical protein
MKDRTKWTRRARWTISAVAVVAVAVAAGGAMGATARTDAAAGTRPADALTPQLQRVKAALDKYRSVDVAKADGYAPASPCESIPSVPAASWFGGAMGIHYVNQGLMKPGPLNPAKPPILVYLPTAGGGLQLVAAEYFKPDADQNLKTSGDRPSIFGRQFDGPMLGHSPGMPIHYDLHVWLWKHNPAGLFAPWNPSASCKR